MAYRIITNNTLVREQLKNRFDVAFVSGEAESVFAEIEQALQSGWQLLTAPLPPNVPLIRSSIRTVILKRAERQYDAYGLGFLAKAQERTATLAKAHRPEQRGDLEHIDWTFVQRSLLELRL